MEELHSAAPAVAKRMWSYLRAVFFMARKGLLSNKRKLLVTVHLLMKRRNKAVARTVAALLSHSHHAHAHALRRRDYEFSCTNSPDPSSASRRRLAYFPCLGAVAEDDDNDYYAASLAPPPLATIDYYAAADASPAPSSSSPDDCCAAACASPDLLMSAAAAGRFSVRVSNYSSEDESVGGAAVDREAEEFIRRFYDQLRRQNAVALLPPYMQGAAA